MNSLYQISGLKAGYQFPIVAARAVIKNHIWYCNRCASYHPHPPTNKLPVAPPDPPNPARRETQNQLAATQRTRGRCDNQADVVLSPLTTPQPPRPPATLTNANSRHAFVEPTASVHQPSDHCLHSFASPKRPPPWIPEQCSVVAICLSSAP